MNIQEAAAASGLTADAIRFYERRSVLPKPPRRENQYREYTEEHVVTLKLAKGLRDVDLSLPEVASILRVWHDGTCEDLRSTLLASLDSALAATDAHIQALEQTRRHLVAIDAGLRQMSARQRRVPGTMPCGCVQLVVSDG